MILQYAQLSRVPGVFRAMTGLTSRLALGVACAALAATSSVVSRADGAPGATDWPSTNYDQTANRYSPLTQITATNVATLRQVWSVHLKPAGFTGPMREDETIPIVIGNTMYLASPYGAVLALDATTGRPAPTATTTSNGRRTSEPPNVALTCGPPER